MPLAKAPLPKQKVVLPDYLECVLEGRDRVGRQHHIGKRALGRDRLDQPPRHWATEQEIPDRLGHVRSYTPSRFTSTAIYGVFRREAGKPRFRPRSSRRSRQPPRRGVPSAVSSTYLKSCPRTGPPGPSPPRPCPRSHPVPARRSRQPA